MAELRGSDINFCYDPLLNWQVWIHIWGVKPT